MTVSYRNKRSEKVAGWQKPSGLPASIIRAGVRKLVLPDHAVVLDDLRSPPGNRLEELSGGRIGQHSTRINRQWQICFVWTNAGTSEVEIVDYHQMQKAR